MKGMGLLVFHVEFSILCLITFIGVRSVFRERISRFTKGKKKRIRIRKYLGLFCPLLNIAIVMTMCYMAFCSDETAERINKTMR